MGEAVACLLEGRRAWTPAFVAGSVAEAIERAAETPIQALVADTFGLRADELQALVDLQRCGATSVVLLVAEPEPGAYLDLPVERVILRQAPSEALFAALDEVAAKVRQVRSRALPFDLSRRELECAQLVSKGMSNRRIAELMGLREQSVKNVVSLAMKKMGVGNRVQIALRLVQAGVDEALPTRAVVSVSIAGKVGAGRE